MTANSASSATRSTPGGVAAMNTSSNPKPLVLAALLLTLGACPSTAQTYCQSGPKYGTQCYAPEDVEDPPGSAHEAPDHTDDDPRGRWEE